jgi:uracil-DNA glycosylase
VALAQEVHACNTWLAREIAAVRPQVIVALGATAIRAVSGLTVKVEEARQLLYRHAGGALMLATYHPSAILRAKGEYQALMRKALKLDLKRAASAVDGAG